MNDAAAGVFRDMPDATTPIADLKAQVRRFGDDRLWQPFHTPKNLAMGLAVETAELMEHFQWIDIAESRAIAGNTEKLAEVRDEIADVLCYLIALANELDVDLALAMADKMIKNAAKYPAEKTRGHFAPPPPE